MSTYSDCIQLIKSRRSIGKVKQDMIPKETVLQVLESGTWAPSHHRTEPWKFFVFTGAARNKLGDVMATIYLQDLGKPDLSEEEQQKLDSQRKKPHRAPVIIAVAALPSDRSQIVVREEVAAVCCAIQNMLLTAHSLGLGAIWRTGKPAYHPLMKKFLRLRDQDELLGFIYLGYPDMPAKEGSRTPAEQKTEWMDAEQ